MSEEDQGEEAGGLPVPVPPEVSWPSVAKDVLAKIPEAYQKSLLKAGIRLIHGAAGVGTAWLEAQAHEIKNKQDSRAKVRDALVKSVTGDIKARPDVVDRAVTHFVDGILGKQENREEVIRVAADELASKGSLPPTQGAPSDELETDWLDGFSRHAENASSDRLRKLFGKILAGEIRKPGSFSLFALDHLAKFSQADTELIVKIAPSIFCGAVIRTPTNEKVVNFSISARLTELGIFNPVSVGAISAQRTYQTAGATPVNGKPAVVLVDPDVGFIITTDEPKPVELQCTILTSVGTEIFSLFNYMIDPIMLGELAEMLKGQGAELYMGNAVPLPEKDRFAVVHTMKIAPIGASPTT